MKMNILAKQHVWARNIACICKRATFVVIALYVLTLFPKHAWAQSSDGKTIVLSLGDSYASGEGIEPFYGQDKQSSEKVKDMDWLAHRSEKSWSSQLVVHNADGTSVTLGDSHSSLDWVNISADDDYGIVQKLIIGNWYFAASSGATTENLTESQTKEYNYDGLTGTASIPPQLDCLDLIDYGTVDFVTLTLGGNDAGFVDILKSASKISPFLNTNNLDDSLNKAIQNLYTSDGILYNIKQAYKEIADRVGPQAAILVADYPTLLKESGSTLFSKNNSIKVNDAVKLFDSEIEKLVVDCQNDGMNIYFISVEDDFAGHEASTENEYINGCILFKEAQDIDKSGFISSYSFHPNSLGAAVYANRIQQFIDTIENTESYPTETPVDNTEDTEDGGDSGDSDTLAPVDNTEDTEDGGDSGDSDTLAPVDNTEDTEDGGDSGDSDTLAPVDNSATDEGKSESGEYDETSFNLIGTWVTGGDASLTFNDDGTFIFDWGFGVEETGTWSAEIGTGDAFPISMNGSSILSFMQLMYGAVYDSYHFEILIQDENSMSLVQVYGTYTVYSSPCALPFTRQ